MTILKVCSCCRTKTINTDSHGISSVFCSISGIACLLNKMARKEATVGVDGSLYRFHPFFHDLMMKKISQLIRPNLSVSFHLLLCFFPHFVQHVGWEKYSNKIHAYIYISKDYLLLTFNFFFSCIKSACNMFMTLYYLQKRKKNCNSY